MVCPFLFFFVGLRRTRVFKNFEDATAEEEGEFDEEEGEYDMEPN